MLLTNRIQNIINLLDNFSQHTQTSHHSEKNDRFQEVSFKRVKTIREIQYVSAIAFKQTKGITQSTMEIAQRIASAIHQSIEIANSNFEQLSFDRVWRHFEVKVSNPGWIHLSLGDRGTAVWLQLLCDCSLPIPDSVERETNNENDNQVCWDATSLFKLQYAHARCCSILRLANREKLIQLGCPSIPAASLEWLISTPNPLPWLTAGCALRFEHPLEYRLINQLVAVLDTVFSPPKSLIEQSRFNRMVFSVAQALADEFQAFYAECRIIGESLSEQLALSQARLGLVLATQSVLRFVLQSHLGFAAPTEL